MPARGDKLLRLQFPHGGLAKNRAYQQQEPYTTPECLNVRPADPLLSRYRGGSRPGLTYAYGLRLGDSGAREVRMLEDVTHIANTGYEEWFDDFSSGISEDIWEDADWLVNRPDYVPNLYDEENVSIEEAGVVRVKFDDLDTSQVYTVSVLISPYSGRHNGNYSLYACLDDTDPNIKTNGIQAYLTIGNSGGTGFYGGWLNVCKNGVLTQFYFDTGSDTGAQSGWFQMTVDGNDVSVFWLDHVLLDAETVTPPSGTRVGFQLKTHVTGARTDVDAFRLQYNTGTANDKEWTTVCASANGNFYRETTPGTLGKLTTDATLASDQLIIGVEHRQKLYIADVSQARVEGAGTVAADALTAAGVSDWTALGIDADSDTVEITNAQGTAVNGSYGISSIAVGALTLDEEIGTGAVYFRIGRAAKVYDPAADTLTIWTADADKGAVPFGCPLIAMYRDSLVLAGGSGNPNIFYVSRQGDANDWDFAQSDAQAAYAANTGRSGAVGQPLTAIAAASDDYMVLAGSTTLWKMAGDPRLGGELINLSRTIGVLDKRAWCWGPEGQFIFLSNQGLYYVEPGGQSYPKPLSRQTLPAQLMNVSRLDYTVLLAFDYEKYGVHIFLTNELGDGSGHFWFDWSTKGFWPVSIPSASQPLAILSHNGGRYPRYTDVLLGGIDGYLRKFSESSPTDNGTPIISHVSYGPLLIGDGIRSGLIREMDITMARGSGAVYLILNVADSPEAVMAQKDSAARLTKVIRSGRNNTIRPRAGGEAMQVAIRCAQLSPWAIEGMEVVLATKGRTRL